MTRDHGAVPTASIDRLIALADSPRRGDDRHLLIEGIGNVVQCADHRVRFEQLVVCKKLLRSTVGQIVARKLRSQGVPALTLTPARFRRISRAERASGIAAVVRTPWRSLPKPSGQGLWITVDRLRSAGNLGTTVRTAVAVGAEGLIVTSSELDPFEPTVVRASMGTVFRLRVIRSTTLDLRRWANSHHIDILGAHIEGETHRPSTTFPPRCVLCLGHEREGLNDEQRAMCDRLVRLPMSPRIDSLNAGVAAGILLYAIAPFASAAWNEFR